MGCALRRGCGQGVRSLPKPHWAKRRRAAAMAASQEASISSGVPRAMGLWNWCMARAAAASSASCIRGHPPDGTRWWSLGVRPLAPPRSGAALSRDPACAPPHAAFSPWWALRKPYIPRLRPLFVVTLETISSPSGGLAGSEDLKQANPESHLPHTLDEHSTDGGSAYYEATSYYQCHGSSASTSNSTVFIEDHMLCNALGRSLTSWSSQPNAEETKSKQRKYKTAISMIPGRGHILDKAVKNVL